MPKVASATCGGVYLITNTVNGKQYVGSTFNFSKRRRDHFWSLARNVHPNAHLQHAFNLYGREAFIFHPLEIVQDHLRRIVREQFYIDTLRPAYNIRRIAHSNIGLTYSLESRERMRVKAIARSQSIEARAELSRRTHSYCDLFDAFPEIRERHRQAIIAGLQAYRAEHPDFERRRVEALRSRLLGVPRTPEVRAKISRSQAGRTYSPETIRNMSLAQYRRFESMEEREKAGQAQRRRFARPEERAKSSARAKEIHSRPGFAEHLNAKYREWVDRPESREYMSKVTTERMNRPEVRARNSEQAKKRMADPARREHLRQINLGKTQSEETRAKKSASLKETYKRKRAAGEPWKRKPQPPQQGTLW